MLLVKGRWGRYVAGFRGKMNQTWRPHCSCRLLSFVRFSHSTLPPPPPLTVDTAVSNNEGGGEEKNIKDYRVSLPPVPLPPLLGEALRTVLSSNEV